MKFRLNMQKSKIFDKIVCQQTQISLSKIIKKLSLPI